MKLFSKKERKNRRHKKRFAMFAIWRESKNRHITAQPPPYLREPSHVMCTIVCILERARETNQTAKASLVLLAALGRCTILIVIIP